MRKLVYYRMRLSTESEIVGTWPQLDVPKNYFKVANNFEILTSRYFPETPPNLENFIFKRPAKLTDLLSSYLPDTDIGVFVNQNFKNLTANFDVKGFQFYNFKLIPADKDFAHQLSATPFFFLHLIHVNTIVNFSQSIFEDLKTNQMITVDNEEQRSPFLPPIARICNPCPHRL